MPKTVESIRKHRDAIVDLARAYGATDVRVFGSVARGDARDDSDLDLVVRFREDSSLLDHGGLIVDLRELLGIKVDVVDEAAMRPRLRAEVLQDAVPL